MTSAYYNEIDPFAAEWLRNLIAERLIAPGEVDERSIEDVTPDDLRGFTQCHFFAGIGVWSYALRNAGWPDDRPVWTGSCPCQPFSAAGKRGGVADERHLWPAFHHLTDEVRPAAVFGEQVASKDGLAWLDAVQADLEASGYAVGTADLCAAGVGAPHIRQRLWFVGVANTEGRRRGRDTRAVCRASGDHGAASRFEGPAVATFGRSGAARGLDDDDDARPQGHAGHDGAAGGRQEPGRSVAEAGVPGGVADDQRAGLRSGGRGEARAAPGGMQGKDGERQRLRADGRPSSSSVVEGPFAAGPTNGIWRDADWLLCRDERWRPVRPGTFPLVNGAPARVGRLRAYGNAIVAEAAREFIEAVNWSIGGDLA